VKRCGDENDAPHFTSIFNDPIFPPLAAIRAVIVTPPFRFPVSTPLADTVAASVLELDQVKLWFGTVFPLLSFAVAASCSVEPRFTFFDGAETVTLATAPIVGVGDGEDGGAGGGGAAGGLTVIVARPDFPSAFAATCDVPTSSAVTTPSAEMLTILGSSTVHVMVASGTISPDPSCTWACRGSCALSASVDRAGLTTIEATCGVASGAVLPHDQLDNATMTTLASACPLLDMPSIPAY
jgi:hypothetical protein